MEERPCKGCGGKRKRGKGYQYCESCIEKRNKKPGCVKCGAPKKPRGVYYCEECAEVQKWVIDKKRHYKPKRLCKKCKKVWISGLKQHCESCRNPVVWCEKCHIRPRRGVYKKYCLPCHLEALEAKLQYRREWRREQRKDPAKVQKMLEQDRRYRARMDQERRDRLNETRRLWWRRTHQVKPVSEAVYEQGVGKKKLRLPAAPLAVVIEEYLSKGNSLLALATEAGVQEKRVGEVYRGRTDTVRIDIADKVCVVCGTTLEWVYDEQIAREEIPLDGDYGLDKAS